VSRFPAPARCACRLTPLAFVLLTGPGSAAGQEPELYLSATEKLDYRRLHQGVERQEALRNRLEVSAYRGAFSAWVRLETRQASNVARYDPFAFLDQAGGEGPRVDETEVSRRSFTFADDSFRGTAGDFSFIFGRGLLFAAFENEELSFDTRLEGVHGVLDHELGSAQALAGSHQGNRFRGVFVERSGWGPMRVGAGFVEAWGAESGTNIRQREQDYGGLTEIECGPLSLYGEYVERRFSSGGGAEGPGHGGFVSGVLSYEGFTLSGEYRDYFRFEHEFHDPPTALKQHTWTLLNRLNGEVQGDINDNDVEGLLAEMSYSPDLFTSLRASFSRAGKDLAGDDYWELYGEAKTTWQEKVFLTGAAAESELTTGTLFDERLAGFGEVIVELDEVQSLTANVEWSEVRETDEVTRAYLLPRDYRDRLFSLSYGRSPWLNLTLAYEDTTDETETRDDWFSVLAEISLADHHDLNIGYGSERGGWKCSGGVCYYEPEFEGLKVRWVARY
jgi:hypothetical protein